MIVNIILSGVVSIVGGVLIFLLQGAIRENRKLRMMQKENDEIKNKAICDGVQCLLRSKLIELYYKYNLDESITRTDYENWSQMFKAYKDLGGNGAIAHMKEDIENLKIRKQN